MRIATVWVLLGALCTLCMLCSVSAERAFAFETGPSVYELAGGGTLRIDTADTRTLPSRIERCDASGRTLWTDELMRLSDPVFSPAQSFLAVRSGRGVRCYNLSTGESVTGPNGRPYAPTNDGRLCVVLPAATPHEDAARVLLVAHPGGDERVALPIGFVPQQMLLSPDAGSALLLGSDRLLRVELGNGRIAVLHRAAEGWRLWELARAGLSSKAGQGEVYRLTERRYDRDQQWERTYLLDEQGTALSVADAAERRIPQAADLPLTRDGLRWPTEPNSQNPIGNTYGEFQYYGGAPYMHPGVDVMGEADQPIYAVKAGWVKAILTTSGEWHWRVAVGDSAGAGECEGYLYAHLEQNSIAVQVGDYVEEGQYLGALVDWPVAGFTHIHFARIRDAGVEWYGNWLCPDNPHLDFVEQTETQPPEFEPAVGSDLLAFCRNETSNYQDPGALSGQVDIIAHIGDQILTDWVCTVQEVRLTIHPLGDPGSPVIDDLLAIYYDMALDTYSGGPIDPFLVDLFYKQDGTCFTEGDYGAREFYYILTNTNGDLVYEEEDFLECWDTRVIPDGEYVVQVTAFDVAGNAASDSMVVTVANGYAGLDGTDAGAGPSSPMRIVLEAPQPNPTRGFSELAFELPSAQRLEAVVLDLGGRQVRRLAGGWQAAGAHRLSWDGRDELGRKVTPGVYFYRLVGEDDTRRQRVLIF